MLNEQLYFDTAALCYSALPKSVSAAPKNTLHTEQKSPVFDTHSVYTAPNATQCIFHFIQSIKTSNSISLYLHEKTHPVVRNVLLESEREEHFDDKKIGLFTVYDWVSDRVFLDNFDQLSKNYDIVLLDAVMAAGTRRYQGLFDRIQSIDNIVVFSSLQKFANCPAPVGIAMIPNALLQKFPSLEMRLCQFDYLGQSISRGIYLNTFPDSYTSILSQIVQKSLNLVLRPNLETSIQHFDLIQRNTVQITKALHNIPEEDLTLYCSDKNSGIVQVKGSLEALKAFTNRTHIIGSFFDTGGKAGEAMLRLSAPLFNNADAINNVITAT